VVGVECIPSYHRVFSHALQQLPSNPVTTVRFKRRLLFRCREKTDVGRPTLCRTLGQARTCGLSSLTSLSAVSRTHSRKCTQKINDTSCWLEPDSVARGRPLGWLDPESVASQTYVFLNGRDSDFRH